MASKDSRIPKTPTAVSGFAKYEGLALSIKAGKGKVAVDFHVPEEIHDVDVNRFLLYLDEVRFRLLSLTSARMDQALEGGNP